MLCENFNSFIVRSNISNAIDATTNLRQLHGRHWNAHGIAHYDLSINLRVCSMQKHES